MGSNDGAQQQEYEKYAPIQIKHYVHYNHASETDDNPVIFCNDIVIPYHNNNKVTSKS